jgi:hypothetical protein
MKTHLTVPTGGLIKIVTKDGKTISNEQIKSIEIEPFFSTSTGPAELLHAETTLSDNSAVDKFTLCVSGTNGKATRRDRVEQGVVPQIEKKKPAAPPAAKDK